MTIDREKLIIAADDFGLNPKSSENILNLVRQGKIDRVAVLVDYSLKKEDILELSTSPVKLDVHLSLKSFDEKMEREKGILKRTLLFLWYYVTKKILWPKLNYSGRNKLKSSSNCSVKIRMA